MAVYDPLEDYLRDQSCDIVTMTFDEVCQIVPLPRSAFNYEWWWSNEDIETTSHVQCRAWQRAGYTAKVDTRSKTVSFSRKKA
jgi:hypothetical protein